MYKLVHPLYTIEKRKIRLVKRLDRLRTPCTSFLAVLLYIFSILKVRFYYETNYFHGSGDLVRGRSSISSHTHKEADGSETADDLLGTL